MYIKNRKINRSNVNLEYLSHPEYFKFLDEMREGGEINMLESPPILMKYFDLSYLRAVEVFHCWISQKKGSK